MYKLNKDESKYPTVELYSGTGQEPSAVYFINGFMADVYAGLESHKFDTDTAIYIVHFERENTIYDLANNIKGYLNVHSGYYDDIKIIGFSAGCIILQRLQTIWDLSIYKDQITTVTIAPITINYFDLLSKFSVVKVKKITEKAAMRIFTKLSWFGDFKKARFEDIRQQMLFILEDDCFRGQQLGAVDIAIFPRTDRICYKLNEVPDIADTLIYTKGGHDLRGLPLSEIFGKLTDRTSYS